MTVLNIAEARKNLYKLIDATSESHDPVLIKGKRHNAVLISEEDWGTIQETINLMSIPGITDSIKKGLETPLEECDEELDW